MNAAQRFTRAITHIGGNVLITPHTGGMTKSFTASIQPLRNEPHENADALGWGIGQRYKMYVPADIEIQRGDTVTQGDKRYLVRWVKPLAVGGEKVYTCAGLTEIERGEKN